MVSARRISVISARFGLERRGKVSQLRAETSEHLLEHVVFG